MTDLRFLVPARALVLALASASLAAMPASRQESLADRNAAFVASNRVVEEHRLFDRMVGEWKTTQKLVQAPRLPETHGQARGELRFGGRYLFLEIEGMSMGKEVTALTIFGFDVHRRTYLAIALGENSTAVYTSEGGYDPDTKTLDLHGEMDDAHGKRPVRYRFRFLEGEGFVFDAFNILEGEESRVVEITYQRAASR